MFPYRKLKAKLKNLFRIGKKGIIFKKPKKNGKDFEEILLTSDEIRTFYKDKENIKVLSDELLEGLEDIEEFEKDMIEYMSSKNINFVHMKTCSGDVFINQQIRN